MQRHYHTVSIEDREMFAYNKRQRDLAAHLAQPENSIKYCYSFMDDRGLYAKAIVEAYNCIGKVNWEEAHY
jgi:hypothetical protein